MADGNVPEINLNNDLRRRVLAGLRPGPCEWCGLVPWEFVLAPLSTQMVRVCGGCMMDNLSLERKGAGRA